MAEGIGHKRWTIAEGYIPEGSAFQDRALTSHETACLLNAGDDDVRVEIILYFADREPAGPYIVQLPAKRVRHVRFDDLREPEPVPRDTDYASVITADGPIVVQHTRLDSRKSEIALLTTTAFAQS